jgi:hypothetical protein
LKLVLSRSSSSFVRSRSKLYRNFQVGSEKKGKRHRKMKFENSSVSQRTLSYRLHDALNIPLVGSLAFFCLLGLGGQFNAVLLTNLFIYYIVLDSLWIALSPSAVPKFSSVILVHHLFTFLILLHPLRYPEHSIETCRDGIVELNTFFLIARRQARRGSLLNVLFSFCYKITLSIRFIWQPYLIYHFHVILNVREGYPLSEYMMVLATQICLCIFNILLACRPRNR